MSEKYNSNKSEQKETDKKPVLKGWNSFLKDGFDKFQKSLENQTKKNKDFWTENKEKTNKFFTGLNQDWDNKIKEWDADIKKRKIETIEQFDAHKKKIGEDFNNWKEKTKKDWNDGVASVRKGFFKAYFWFLVLTIPILIIVIVVFVIINSLIG
ncbi:hypothetical protein LCGC14_0959870 [marine sediment metagenome]|uniref:Uncharacterized protein n=1 Tax=marine sediment metagenome TaxID=412755 RepID=A0A0F9NER8_9ZZZZ|nr:MAG: hypothetical protein Lokiarch_49600 [Candidatus Lokiarchaeum sp. GC14_75]